MKKAKILLTAITIFAVVGGIFAFKAKIMSEQFICIADKPGGCYMLTNMYTLNPNAPNPYTTLYTTNTITVNFVTTCPENDCTVLTPLYTEEVE